MKGKSGPYYSGGYYDSNGKWQQTKFCFTSCGTDCTCKPPNGVYQLKEEDDTRDKWDDFVA